MKILISIAEGYQLSESARLIYSPGYERSDLDKSEHECLCIISKLIEARLKQEGHAVESRRYDESRNAEFLFDKARHSRGADVAVMIALNNSQKAAAQFSTAMVTMVQDDNTRNLFDGMLHSLSRFIPIQSRFPNNLRRIPFLEGCKRNGVPAVLVLPFFITAGQLNNDMLGKYITDSAKAISEALLAYRPNTVCDKDVSEY